MVLGQQRGGCLIFWGAACAVLVSGEGYNTSGIDGARVQRRELFISYSHKDRSFLEQFWVHLSLLEEEYGLQRWDEQTQAYAARRTEEGLSKPE
ncbi:MAG: hypothetical protein ACKOPS_13915, partial [Cyanobium sp.]